MGKEYFFNRIETENVSVDFDRLFKDIITDNPNIGMSDIDISEEFGNNSGYYLEMQLGYDPYDKFYEAEHVIDDIWADFDSYLTKKLNYDKERRN